MLWTTSTLDHTCFFQFFGDHIRLKFTIHTAHKGCFCLSSVVSKHNCPPTVSPQCSIKPAQRRWLSIPDQCTFTSYSLGLGYYVAGCLFGSQYQTSAHLQALLCLWLFGLQKSPCQFKAFFHVHTKSNICRQKIIS